MVFFNNSTATRELQARLDALDKSQAVIEFGMDGTILTANSNFLNAIGYDLSEIQNRHHNMFVDPEFRNSAEYKNFWADLNRGEFKSGEFKRLAKGGREIWIQASYNPIFNASGKPVKVVKYATDITDEKLRNSDYLGQINAVNKSQAVIEFALDGTITQANENFLNAVGYTLDEVKGKNHSIFVDADYRSSPEYRNFWSNLNRGEYQAGEFKRIHKNGRPIWIQASYNPIMDMSGKPFKVVKYATDITKQVELIDNVKKLIDENLFAIDHSVVDAISQASAVSHASMGTLANVQAVAAGAEELNASVNEISESMSRSAAAVDEVFQQSATADSAAKRLTQSMQSMGGIVELIQNIAGQINLLALNATIESARAGEAGKGFAVVASEVKNLARQAAEATQQISKEIEGMRAVSTDVVTSLDAIRESVNNVRDFVTGTASAVQEQSAVTQEISSNMQTAAAAVASITDSIDKIEQSTRAADSAVKQTQEAAKDLAK